MNQIMNVAAIGINTTQQASLRKPAHAAKANLAPRKDAESSFRIPRGESASATPAGNPAGNSTARKQQPARPARRNPNQGNGQHGNDHGKGGHHSSGGRGNHNRNNASNANNGKRKALIALLLIALLLAGFGIWKFMNLSPEEATGGAFYDQSASEIQEAVDHEVEDGYFNMSINTSVPVFEDNSAAIGIRNIESNQYDCIVTVTLDDGTEVYKSGGLAPGTELSMVTLTQDLEPGDYEATAVFEIIEQDEAHTVAGQTASKLTLHVL